MAAKFLLADTCVAAAHAYGFSRFSWNTLNATGILPLAAIASHNATGILPLAATASHNATDNPTFAARAPKYGVVSWWSDQNL
jgi:hypothetical protein